MYFDKFRRDNRSSRRLGLIRSHPKSRVRTETPSEEAQRAHSTAEAHSGANPVSRVQTRCGEESFAHHRLWPGGWQSISTPVGPVILKPGFGWGKQILSHPASQSQGVASVLCCDRAEAKDGRPHRKQQDGSGALEMQRGRSLPVSREAWVRAVVDGFITSGLCYVYTYV